LAGNHRTAYACSRWTNRFQPGSLRCLLVAALRAAYPAAGRSLSAGLRGPQMRKPRSWPRCCSRILRRWNLVLVLDDYHLVRDKDIHVFMARVVQRAPDEIHWVLISRADPPIGLRAARRGNSRASQSGLRFTRDETRADSGLLEKRIGRDSRSSYSSAQKDGPWACS